MRYSLNEHAPRIHAEAFIAPNATLIAQVTIEPEASVWFGAVLRGDNEPIVIGAQSNIQDGAVLHTDPGAPLNVGQRVSVAHLAMLHGCTVGDESLIGVGAVILNHAQIGRQCLIGAGALIPEGKQIPDGSLVIGQPGRVVRTLSDAEQATLRDNARHYVEKTRRYRLQLRAVE